MSIGIIAFDEFEHQDECYSVDADWDDSDFQAFVTKCNALLKTSRKAHAELVTAAIKYGTTDSKLPEAEKFGECVLAFMGEDFNLSALGDWEKLNHFHNLNQLVINGNIEHTLLLVAMVDPES